MKINLSDHGVPPPAPAALQQTPQYARALAAMGTRVMVVAGHSDAGMLAQALIVRRRIGPLTLNWLPLGPIWKPGLAAQHRDAFLSNLTRILSGGAVWLGNAETEVAAGDFTAHGFHSMITPTPVARLDLSPPATTRMAAQHGKWRNRLRHAQSADLVVRQREFDPTRDADFLARETAQRRKRRYRALPVGFTLKYAAQNPGSARLWSAHKNGALAAQMLILHHGVTATYHIGWTNEIGRKTSAHNLLLWQAQAWLAERGVTRLDLGLIDTDHTPGLARFKLGSGAALCTPGPTMIRFAPPALFQKRHRPAA
ncbi:GNAT family N-acetyltransferase [uncultured Roseovarius sp.]|uniref:GNAT family N-acetyltransferase n=1 Tax=Roseovarius sp. TaxID=1486281 RepID=UPI0025CDCDB0|nr:GNAT family N-acetyltransferase [uncultured Roseovarius sp.]